jgi:hypothetical protein
MDITAEFMEHHKVPTSGFQTRASEQYVVVCRVWWIEEEWVTILDYSYYYHCLTHLILL